MSLYREVGRPGRRAAVVVAAALVVGLAAGLAIGRATAPEPSLADAVAQARNETQEVLDGLELVEIEYSQGTVEPRAARAAAERTRRAFTASEADLRALDPAGAERVSALLEQLEQLVAAGAPAARVRAIVDRASRELRAIVGR